MFRMHGRLRAAVVVCGMALTMTGAASAQSVANDGLGKAWPNATDVSASRHWHVYVFNLNGVNYVQVNDLAGQVRAAIGSVNGATFVLPMGVDTIRVGSEKAQSATDAAASVATPASTTETVYQDATTTVTATTLSSGVTTFDAEVTCTGDPYNCTGH